jgi:flagellar assembly protein FliH
MAASRITKTQAPSVATPYTWNGPAPSPRNLGSAAAHPQAEAHSTHSYESGFRDGEAAGRQSKADAAFDQLAETIATLAKTRASVFHAAQGDILRLAIAVARRILHREIHMSTDVLGGVIAAALDRIEDQDLYRARVHPSFAPRLQEQLDARMSGRNIEVVPDPGLPLGGCIFETQHGNIDASIESQLSEIERGLADHLKVLR